MKHEKKGKWLELIVPPEWNSLSIQSILKEHYQAPKLYLHQLRMNQGVKVNGQQLPWNYLLKTDEKLQIELFDEEDYGVIPDYMDIQILYEDDHVLIVNKPAGLDTHPTTTGQIGTLANAVAFHYQINGISTKIRHIHRLDRDTTGAILFAKDRLSGAILDRRLENRDIKRTYHALAHGRLKQKSGKIDASIGKDRHHPTRRRVSPTGQTAISLYKVLHEDLKANLSLVQLHLQTGRTHQIRVHMSHLGHPLAGDILYGGKPIFPRQALHAAQISFQHPITNEQINCQAPYLDQPPIFTVY
jgi:23S rRNA pseudouridine1911/1915/1917 synthase